MDTNKEIKRRLDQIASAADSILSVGTQATLNNAPQLLGIQRAAQEIWSILNAKEATDNG